MKRIIKNDVFKYLAVIIPVAVFIYVFNLFTPLFYDDYAYAFSYNTGQRISSVFDIFPSQYSHYYLINGRLVVHFLAQFFMLIGKNAFNIINTFAFILLGWLMYVHAYGRVKEVKILPMIFTYFSLFMFTPAFGQSFLWISGSANYLYGSIIVLLFLLPYRFGLNKDNKKSMIKILLSSLLMLIFGIVAGDTIENNAVAVVCIVALYIVYRLIKFKKVQIWAITGFIGSVVGCLFLLASPGIAKNRLGDAGFSGVRIFDIAKNTIEITFKTFQIFSFLFVLLSTLLIFYTIRFIKNNRNIKGKKRVCSYANEMIYAISFFILFLVSHYSMSVAPSYIERAWSVPLVFLTIAIICVYKHCECYFEYKKLCSNSMIVILSSIFVCTYFNNILEVKRVYDHSQDIELE